MEFKLDVRLKQDCHIIAESDCFYLLLMNNSLVPWFILVPKTDKTEIYQLEDRFAKKTYKIINRLSKFIEDEFQPDKLNLGAIGNIVSQMHIHVIGRYKTDAYWPGVVWGGTPGQSYDPEKVKQLKISLYSILEI
jgi:diadenosine tetraphosphate (Ap4A) HIT family hydrolase